MYCTKCGTKNREDAQFCVHCGHAFPKRSVPREFCSQCGQVTVNGVCSACGPVKEASVRRNLPGIGAFQKIPEHFFAAAKRPLFLRALFDALIGIGVTLGASLLLVLVFRFSNKNIFEHLGGNIPFGAWVSLFLMMVSLVLLRGFKVGTAYAGAEAGFTFRLFVLFLAPLIAAIVTSWKFFQRKINTYQAVLYSLTYALASTVFYFILLAFISVSKEMADVMENLSITGFIHLFFTLFIIHMLCYAITSKSILPGISRAAKTFATDLAIFAVPSGLLLTVLLHRMIKSSFLVRMAGPIFKPILLSIGISANMIVDSGLMLLGGTMSLDLPPNIIMEYVDYFDKAPSTSVLGIGVLSSNVMDYAKSYHKLFLLLAIVAIVIYVAVMLLSVMFKIPKKRFLYNAVVFSLLAAATMAFISTLTYHSMQVSEPGSMSMNVGFGVSGFTVFFFTLLYLALAAGAVYFIRTRPLLERKLLSLEPNKIYLQVAVLLVFFICVFFLREYLFGATGIFFDQIIEFLEYMPW